MKRTLDKGHIAQKFEIATGSRVALDASAALGEEDERKIRPFALRPDEGVQRAKIRAAKRLIGDQPETRSAKQDVDKILEPRRDRTFDACLAQHRGGDIGVSSSRRENDRPL